MAQKLDQQEIKVQHVVAVNKEINTRIDNQAEEIVKIAKAQQLSQEMIVDFKQGQQQILNLLLQKQVSSTHSDSKLKPDEKKVQKESEDKEL